MKLTRTEYAVASRKALYAAAKIVAYDDEKKGADVIPSQLIEGLRMALEKVGVPIVIDEPNEDTTKEEDVT